MAELKSPDDTSSHLAKYEQGLDVEGQGARRDLEKRLLLKVDLRMSYLILIYIVNIVDRNNTPAARLRGLERDLHLHGPEYSTVLSILFVGYISMQIPSNMFMNYIGKPSIYLPSCAVLWGVISMLSGITRNFVGALLCRFFIGFVEASFVPGALFLLSKWYKRGKALDFTEFTPVDKDSSDELGVRVAILFCATYASNAFGALIAASILDTMEGTLGQAAWRWLCFIEGAITIAIALLGFFILPDFPGTSGRWLSPEERALATERLAEEDGTGPTSHMEGLKIAMKDWKVWYLAVLMAVVQLSLSFIVFFPTLTATLGYGLTTTLLLCAPPWVITTVFAFVLTRHSDSKSERCWHSIFPMIIGMIGSVMAMSTMNTPARYVSLFLMAQSPVGPVITMAWSMTSLQPANKRAVAIAIINATGQLGLVAGPYAWDKKWGPTYRKSFAICLTASGLSIVMSLFFRYHLAALNLKAQKEEDERGQTVPGFRYHL
ncbi:hypothetical protein PLEOSDRAFT_1105130 [Pleurotus ostreatus PC15]|uniref:Major facilitator superfamily (MFS) profile domain-containing protein n=1 Tax=Pleurotus ostreatus (strain PC15) TaxID=1137138 RepID=A0A067NK66_PLEO1|nr:hypothetical protein PLEOSDRAFT_1105130 [Pleurotus ostreatus PC15]